MFYFNQFIDSSLDILDNDVSNTLYAGNDGYDVAATPRSPPGFGLDDVIPYAGEYY